MTTRREPGRIARDFSSHVPKANLLLNGGFRVWQRAATIDAATTFVNTDDNLCADRWLILSESASDGADYSEETTTIPDRSHSALKMLLVDGANMQGVAQILEAKDTIPLRGLDLILSFDVSSSSGPDITEIRAGVLEWTSTADAVTSDLVGSWNAEDSNPTPATNWAFLNTPEDLAVTATYQRHALLSVTVGATANNLAVFFWTNETTLSAGDELFIGNVKLEESSEATDFETLPFADELLRCQRYFWKTFGYDVAPAVNLNDKNGVMTAAGSDSKFSDSRSFPLPMFKTPTVVTYNFSSTGSAWRNEDDDTNLAETVQAGSTGVTVVSQTAPGGTELWFIHATAEAEL